MTWGSVRGPQNSRLPLAHALDPILRAIDCGLLLMPRRRASKPPRPKANRHSGACIVIEPEPGQLLAVVTHCGLDGSGIALHRRQKCLCHFHRVGHDFLLFVSGLTIAGVIGQCGRCPQQGSQSRWSTWRKPSSRIVGMGWLPIVSVPFLLFWHGSNLAKVGKFSSMTPV